MNHAHPLNLTHAITQTGLFHQVSADRMETLCGMPVAGMVATMGEWLTDHPWDLCRRCKDIRDARMVRPVVTYVIVRDGPTPLYVTDDPMAAMTTVGEMIADHIADMECGGCGEHTLPRHHGFAILIRRGTGIVGAVSL